jgi:regulator of replication initiation timing
MTDPLIKEARERANEAVIRLHLAAHLESSAADEERDAALSAIHALADALEEAEKRLDAELKARRELLDAHSQMNAELTRLREENELLRGQVEYRLGSPAELTHLREENERLRDALRRIAEAAAHWVESSRQMEHRARQALEEKPR